MALPGALNWFAAKGMHRHEPGWESVVLSTAPSPGRIACLLRPYLSPILHPLSTRHPEARVEINWFTLSANALSSCMSRATFSHAYITVV